MDRRVFLRRLGGTAAALALAPSLATEEGLAGSLILGPPKLESPQVGDFMALDGRTVTWAGDKWVDVTEEKRPNAVNFTHQDKSWTIYPGWLAWRGKVYCFECFAQQASLEGGIQGWANKPHLDRDVEVRCDVCGSTLQHHSPRAPAWAYTQKIGRY